MTHTRIYNSWDNMKQRCLNENRADFPNYGGRGITICDEWINSFERFRDDMLPTYEAGLTLDRIDVNGNYCKENCRWATKKEQSVNTRRNRHITFNGLTKTLTEWGVFFGIKRSTLSQRFYVYKWDLNDCFNQT